MRKLVVNTFLSLDGVMQAPGAPDEDPAGGFTQGGWSMRYWDDVLETHLAKAMAEPFELLLGRATYETFAAYWPHAPEEEGAAMNVAVKHVATRTRTDLGWANSRRIEGDVAEYVTALKKTAGPDLHVHGSWGLLQTLLANDLVDEFRLSVFPVLTGAGKRLFSDGTVPQGLELAASTTSTSGVLVTTYTRSA